MASTPSTDRSVLEKFEADPSQHPEDEVPTLTGLARRITEAQVEEGLRPVSSLGSRVTKDEESSTPATPSGNVRTIHGFTWIAICISIYTSCFLYGLDTTIAADVQGSVVEAFGDVSRLAWLGAGFPLGSVAVVLPYGKVFTAFNMKWLFIGGNIIFEAGSVLCGAAPNMSALIVGRVLAGVGGSGIYLGCLNYMSALTAPKERGLYVTGTGLFWGLGAVLGPVIGGAFSVSAATWRWAFYINLVIGAVTIPVFIYFLPSIRPVKGVSVLTRIARIDHLGTLLSITVWATFSYALISAGTTWSWGDGRNIALLVVCGVVLVAYIIQQYFCIFTTPENRSFPAHLLKSRTQVLLYIGTSATMAGIFITTYYIPIYFQFVQSDGALMAAVRLLPFLLVTVFFNLGAGYFLSKVKYYMPFYLASGILLTIGGALIFKLLKPSTSNAAIYGFTILTGAGSGLTLQIGYAVATLVVEPSDVVNAISMQNVSQLGAAVFSLVIGSQIFQTTAVRNLSNVLSGLNYSEADIKSAVAGVQSTLFQELSSEVREQAILAITGAMQKSFILVMVGGAVMIVTGAAMKREKLFGEVTLA